MLLRIRHFAVLREHRGKTEESIDVNPGTAVGALYNQLFPASELGSLPVMYAVNQVYVDAGHVLEEGDEVAFIPPLGGG